MHGEYIDGALPPIAIPAGDYERLAALAESASRDSSSVADYLVRELGRARILDERTFDPQVVRIGSRVSYVDEASGLRRTVRLVWPPDADATRHSVSVVSPVGAALLGMRPGQAIDWPGPMGDMRRLEVLSVDLD